MTLPRITAILDRQEVDVSIHPSGQCAQARILGIDTTAEKIMEAVGGGWNEAIEAAAKLFEPGCSCPEPCEDYLIWPSPCATKAAAQIRSLRRPDAAPSAPPPQPPAPVVSEETEEILEAIDSVIAQEAANRAIPPQPPAPAEGGTDVGELLNRLNMWLDNDYVRRCPDYIKSRSLDHAIGGAFDALSAQAAALAAKEVEIATLKSDLKCETDRYVALVASDSDKLAAKEAEIASLKETEAVTDIMADTGFGMAMGKGEEVERLTTKRIAALEAALRKIENIAYSGVNDYDNFSSYKLDLILDAARAELAQKGPSR